MTSEEDVPQVNQRHASIDARDGARSSFDTTLTPMILVTIGLSAFLSFQIQPLLGKAVLPVYGGGAAVWTTCLLFFQLALVTGYAYAYSVERWLTPLQQAWLHSFLLLATMFFLPQPATIAPTEEVVGNPVWHLMWQLMQQISVPFVILSTTAPLVQAWYRSLRGGASPFWLYAASNAGSLAGLLAYPVLIEPHLTLVEQASWWCRGYAVFVVLACFVAWRVRGALYHVRDERGRPSVATVVHDAGVKRETVCLWLLLSATGSVMLLATSNLLCQDVAPVPFLWITPLCVYLLSFIICFAGETYYRRTWAVPALVGGTLLSLGIWWHPILQNLVLQVVVQLLVLGAACVFCHGELYRLRPDASRLAWFYLVLAIGGALGGIAVNVIAPWLLTGFYEYYVGLFICGCLAWYLPRYEPHEIKDRLATQRAQRRLMSAMIGLLLSGALAVIVSRTSVSAGTTPRAARNFYGTLRVTDYELRNPLRSRRLLAHGTTVHGFQFLNDVRRRIPTSYFGRGSGVEWAFTYAQRRAGNVCHVGIVGLGTGTLAAYARPSDQLDFFEINPLVVEFAEHHFTYLHDARAQGTAVAIEVSDARQRLRQWLDRQRVAQYDLLVLDAFSGDSIPAHLLTRECQELYWQHLRPEGLLAVHVSNRHLDLAPVIRWGAEEHAKTAVRFVRHPLATDEDLGIHGVSTWIIVANDPNFLNDPETKRRQLPWTDDDRAPILWTDNQSSLWPLLQVPR